ncbi:hypothetical protein [Rhizobium binxianense]
MSTFNDCFTENDRIFLGSAVVRATGMTRDCLARSCRRNIRCQFYQKGDDLPCCHASFTLEERALFDSVFEELETLYRSFRGGESLQGYYERRLATGIDRRILKAAIDSLYSVFPRDHPCAGTFRAFFRARSQQTGT